MQRVVARDGPTAPGVMFVRGEDNLEMRLPEYDALTDDTAPAPALGMLGLRRLAQEELPVRRAVGV